MSSCLKTKCLKRPLVADDRRLSSSHKGEAAPCFVNLPSKRQKQSRLYVMNSGRFLFFYIFYHSEYSQESAVVMAAVVTPDLRYVSGCPPRVFVVSWSRTASVSFTAVFSSVTNAGVTQRSSNRTGHGELRPGYSSLPVGEPALSRRLAAAPRITEDKCEQLTKATQVGPAPT